VSAFIFITLMVGFRFSFSWLIIAEIFDYFFFDYFFSISLSLLIIMRHDIIVAFDFFRFAASSLPFRRCDFLLSFLRCISFLPSFFRFFIDVDQPGSRFCRLLMPDFFLLQPSSIIFFWFSSCAFHFPFDVVALRLFSDYFRLMIRDAAARYILHYYFFLSSRP